MVGSGKLFFHHPIDVCHFLPNTLLVVFLDFFIILLFSFFVVLELIKHLITLFGIVSL
jgi:hypothetical protein